MSISLRLILVGLHLNLVDILDSYILVNNCVAFTLILQLLFTNLLCLCWLLHLWGRVRAICYTTSFYFYLISLYINSKIDNLLIKRAFIERLCFSFASCLIRLLWFVSNSFLVRKLVQNIDRSLLLTNLARKFALLNLRLKYKQVFGEHIDFLMIHGYYEFEDAQPCVHFFSRSSIQQKFSFRKTDFETVFPCRFIASLVNLEPGN